MSGRDEVRDHPEYKLFLDMIAKTGEHFEEYLVIVKAKDEMIDWRSSDKTWAMGAAERYLNIGHAEDEVNIQRSIE